MKSAPFAIAAALALAFASAGLADDLKAEQKSGDTTIGFDLKGDYSNVTLSVVGPGGFHASAFSRSGAPSIDLRRHGAVEDGTYTYQLTAATGEKVKVRTRSDDGRASGMAREPYKGVAMSGTFQVKDGAIVKASAPLGDSKRDQP
jgi:hypothetical protein